MFDKEFLKTLTVLYVEDDESIRKSLFGILNKVFGEVIACNDGAEGIEQFKTYVFDKQQRIDVVISDINMPVCNGIEMVKNIREIDSEVPVIFTTAHGEANYLMEAIKLKIVYYALKPIDTTALLQNISKFCMIEHNKQIIFQKEKEISQYMDIINNVSIMFKVNIDGNIVESNEMLSDVLEYTKQDLENMKIQDILDENTFVTVYQDIEKHLDKNETYKGIIKFKSKNSNTFYLNSTIIPTFNNSTATINGYLYIGFDQTDEELEKQQTMQRVRKNIISQRSKESSLKNEIKELEYYIANLKQTTLSTQDTNIVMEKLKKEKQKVQKLNTQIEHYEAKILDISKQKEQLLSGDKEKKAAIMKRKNKSLSETEKLQSKIIELQAKISKLEAKLRPTSYE